MALLFSGTTVVKSFLADLVHIPTTGGYPLTDIVLGKSSSKDIWGRHYYFFVYQPKRDVFVSGAMLKGGWDTSLNSLFSQMLLTDTKNKHFPVVDVGANLGAFTLHAASLGSSVWSFEMQPIIYTLLEMSVRVSGYRHHVKIFNFPMWNTTNTLVDFTPMEGNFGGTAAALNGTGAHKAKTQRFDQVFNGTDIFFMKIDVENAEAYVLSGAGAYLAERRIHHLVLELRSNQCDVMDMVYDAGYRCSLFNLVWWTRTDAKSHLGKLGGNAYSDVYCSLAPRASN
jgi:FkbM family methyltransferase